MAITFTGTGGYFTREGLVIGIINQLNDNRDSTFIGYLNDLQAQYLATLQDVVDQLYIQGNSWVGAQNGFMTYLQTVGNNTTIDVVEADTALNPQTLLVAMTEIVRQMYTQSKTVEAPTVSSSVTYGNGVVSNTGTGKAFCSTLNGKGVQMDYVYDETVKLVCSNDAQGGSATAGQEVFTFAGEAPVSNRLSYLWPAGSGASGTITTSTAAVEEDESANLLNNSNFDTYTVANTPDDWTIVSGVAGTTIFEGGSGDSLTNTNCLKFTGHAGADPSITQTFNTAGQTEAALTAEIPYLVSFWTKVSAVPAAGVLTIDLIDGTGTVVADSAGTNNTTAVTLSGQTTSYANNGAFFRLPKAIPSGTRLRVRLSTDIDTAKSVFISELTFTPATQFYAGGPFCAVVRGATNWIESDQINAIPTNDYAGAFQLGFQRVFNMNSLGLQLPSSGAPNISDALVTT